MSRLSFRVNLHRSEPPQPRRAYLAFALLIIGLASMVLWALLLAIFFVAAHGLFNFVTR